MQHKTDKFMQKRWGVFVHYLNSMQNNADAVHSRGIETQWSDCVADVDAEKTARALHDMGAGYFFITLQQRTRFLLAPNETYDRISGYTCGAAAARRDLPADLIKALSKYDIPLFLYFTGDGPMDDKQAGAAFGFTSHSSPVTVPYVEKWASVAREYSLRYGENVWGWWVDGCYAEIGYTEPTLKIMADALRAGNKNTLVSLNCGVEDRINAYGNCTDFTTGEKNDFIELPESRFINGSQWHTLSFLGHPREKDKPWTGWGQPGCRYDANYMRDYVNRANERGGVVTVDLCMYRDGSFDPAQADLVSRING